MPRATTALLLLVLTASTAGCFHYVPVEAAPPQGTPVRAFLHRPVPVELREITANNIVMVRGEVIREEDERLLLSAFALESASEFEHVAAGETVALPRDALERIEVKRISPTRTALAGAALAAAGYLVNLALQSLGGGDDGGGGGPPIK